jgi:hypothetical protein
VHLRRQSPVPRLPTPCTDTHKVLVRLCTSSSRQGTLEPEESELRSTWHHTEIHYYSHPLLAQMESLHGDGWKSTSQLTILHHCWRLEATKVFGEPLRVDGGDSLNVQKLRLSVNISKKPSALSAAEAESEFCSIQYRPLTNDCSSWSKCVSVR